MKNFLLLVIFSALAVTQLNAADISTGTGTTEPPDGPGSLPSEYTITASANMPNGGYTNGGGAYSIGSQVMLDAIPNPGWVFVNWTEYGSQISTDATCEVKVNADRQLIANFVKQVAITVTSTPSNGGYTSGANTYPSGEMIKLQAYPNNGWVFSKWTENGVTVSTSESFSTNADASHNFVANFVSTVGLPLYQVPSFKIYPNPTDGQLIIENSTHSQAFISEITLVNNAGQCVYRKNDNFSDKMVIDISGSTPGRYNLRISLTDGKFNNYKIMLTD